MDYAFYVLSILVCFILYRGLRYLSKDKFLDFDKRQGVFFRVVLQCIPFGFLYYTKYWWLIGVSAAVVWFVTDIVSFYLW